jgi:type VI secretion system protein ImpG
VRGALRLRFETTQQVPVASLKLDHLPLFLNGTADLTSKLQELIHTQCVGIMVHAGGLPVRNVTPLTPENLRAEGFASEQAALPLDSRAFEGYRLLHEYFAFPERYRFFSINQLQSALRQIEGNQFEVVLLFKTANSAIESVVDADNFVLNCSPVVNLFERTSDRIPVTSNRFEYHAVIDRAKPLDYEIHTIRSVRGHYVDSEREILLHPFYAAADTDRRGVGAYFSVRREPRMLSEQSRRHGPRTGYIGSECFISLVDANEAPFPEALRQITVEALCTNRDLSLLTPVGNVDTDLTMMESAPVDAIRFVTGPSRPTPALAEREITWRLISHLSLNFLTMTDIDPAHGASALRTLLDLYARLGATSAEAQISAIQNLSVRPINRRVPQAGPIVYGRGVKLDLTLDELPFAGVSPWLLGAVLDQMFARHVGINAFTELSLASVQRGVIANWKPQIGRRPTA